MTKISGLYLQLAWKMLVTEKWETVRDSSLPIYIFTEVEVAQTAGNCKTSQLQLGRS